MGRIQLYDVQEERLLKHWNRLPRDVMEPPSQEMYGCVAKEHGLLMEHSRSD